MATLYVTDHFELTGASAECKGGSKSAPASISVDGKVKEWLGSIAATSSKTIWEASNSNESLTDFDFLAVECNENVILELTCDANNGVGTKTFAIEVPGGRMFKLTADDAIANFTTDVSVGTEDVIDKVRIRNASATSSITARVVLIT